LSKQIKKLEDVLGIKLLERTNKSILFTPEGIAIAQRARAILTQVDELHEFAKLAKDPMGGELKIGIFPTLAPYFLPLIMPAISKAFPKLSVYLVEEQTASLIENLKAGKLDAVFLALPFADNNVTKIPLFHEEFLLATPKSHATSRLKSVKQTDLDNQKLLLLEEGHCLRDQALSLCQKLKVTEIQDFRATSLETLRHMVASGLGMTLIPNLACDTNKNIAYIPFSAPKPVRSICLAWRDTTAKQPLLLKIADSIKKTLLKEKAVRVIS
jgi:LysR family hydrogen peroxide-inducible transcriptional activator